MRCLPAIIFPMVIVAASAHLAAAPGPAELGKIFALSTKAEKDKDYATAIIAVKSFQQRGGDPFLSALRLGWLHFQAADYANAAQSYNQAATLKPTSLNALLGVLNASAALQDIRKTALAAEAVLRVEPTNYRALVVIGGLHFAQSEYRKAAADYARVLVNYPDDPDALSGAAWSALRMEDHATALTRFGSLLSMNPDYPQAQEGYRLAARTAR